MDGLSGCNQQKISAHVCFFSAETGKNFTAEVHPAELGSAGDTKKEKKGIGMASPILQFVMASPIYSSLWPALFTVRYGQPYFTVHYGQPYFTVRYVHATWHSIPFHCACVWHYMYVYVPTASTH